MLKVVQRKKYLNYEIFFLILAQFYLLFLFCLTVFGFFLMCLSHIVPILPLNVQKKPFWPEDQIHNSRLSVEFQFNAREFYFCVNRETERWLVKEKETERWLKYD